VLPIVYPDTVQIPAFETVSGGYGRTPRRLLSRLKRASQSAMQQTDPTACDRMVLATRWSVEATIEEVAAILEDVESLPRWWPEVYLQARILAPGGADGVGRRFTVLARGWLPYTLRWQGEVVESRKPHGWTIAATGDLTGEGIWRLTQNGPLAEISFDWTVDVQKRGLRPLARLLRPVFAANHRWAMARGLEGLRREISRRRS